MQHTKGTLRQLTYDTFATRCALVLIGNVDWLTATIAREHLAALAEMPNADVAAVCDISAARAEATAERFGIANWSRSRLAMQCPASMMLA